MKQKLIDTKEFMKKLTEEIDAVSSEDYDGEELAEYDWASGWWISTKLINKVMESTPAIEAEPVKHGKWIYKVFQNGIGYFMCSECGQAIWIEKDNHYCFNCGAKMDLGEIEE